VRAVPVAGALLVASAFSVLFRTGDLDAGLWIDEGIAVGIASHPPAAAGPPRGPTRRYRSTVRAEIFRVCAAVKGAG
jgi:hypothetical protein